MSALRLLLSLSSASWGVFTVATAGDVLCYIAIAAQLTVAYTLLSPLLCAQFMCIACSVRS
jgi:hypothetical protein